MRLPTFSSLDNPTGSDRRFDYTIEQLFVSTPVWDGPTQLLNHLVKPWKDTQTHFAQLKKMRLPTFSSLGNPNGSDHRFDHTVQQLFVATPVGDGPTQLLNHLFKPWKDIQTHFAQLRK